MGIIIGSVDMQEKFKKLRNQDYIVDKSNIVNGNQKVCITKPRRFGKITVAPC